MLIQLSLLRKKVIVQILNYKKEELLVRGCPEVSDGLFLLRALQFQVYFNLSSCRVIFF